MDTSYLDKYYPARKAAEILPRARVQVKRLSERLWEVSGSGRRMTFPSASTAYREVKRRNPLAQLPEAER